MQSLAHNLVQLAILKASELYDVLFFLSNLLAGLGVDGAVGREVLLQIRYHCQLNFQVFDPPGCPGRR